MCFARGILESELCYRRSGRYTARCEPPLVYYSRRSVPGLNRSAQYLLRVFYCCNEIYSIRLSDSRPTAVRVHLSPAELRRPAVIRTSISHANACARDTKNHCSRSGYNTAIRNATRGRNFAGYANSFPSIPPSSLSRSIRRGSNL